MWIREYNVDKEDGRVDRYRILYEDEDVLVVYKVAGVAVQSARVMEVDVMSLLRNELMERGVREPYLGLVNRLDQPVEGLLVFALTKTAAADLSRQLAEGRLRKKYLAVLSGIPAEKEGTLVQYLRKDGRRSMTIVTDRPQEGAKRAELSYRILSQRERQCLAEIEIATGRFHQIRAQMAHAGYPLAGDRKYGMPEQTTGSPALCAYWLSFQDTVSKQERQFSTKPRNAAFSVFRAETGALVAL